MRPAWVSIALVIDLGLLALLMYPAWAADGKLILFSQRRGDSTNPRPWLMSVQVEDGGEATRLNFPTPVEDVEFSPDGLWLVIEGMDNQVDTETQTRLDRDARQANLKNAFAMAPGRSLTPGARIVLVDWLSLR